MMARRIVAWVLVMGALASGAVDAGHPGLTWPLRTIDAERLKPMLDRGERLVIVGVRPPEEFVEVTFRARTRLARRVRSTVPRASTTRADHLYCGCPHSEISRAYQFLRFSGYANVAVLHGGLPEWVAAGMTSTDFV